MRARGSLSLAAVFCAGLLWLAGCRVEAVTRGPGDGLASRRGVLYRGKEPFTGLVIDTFPGGRTASRASYLRGRKHGVEHAYYPDGAPRWTREYFRGEKEGLHAGWWENGNRMFENRFRAGEYEGEAREWYADGKPARTLHYAHGVESGMQRAWRPNGTVYANYEARDGHQYGVVNARLCYTVKDGKGVFRAPE